MLHQRSTCCLSKASFELSSSPCRCNFGKISEREVINYFIQHFFFDASEESYGNDVENYPLLKQESIMPFEFAYREQHAWLAIQYPPAKMLAIRNASYSCGK